MRQNPKKTSQLTPLQILVIVVVLMAAAFQFFNKNTPTGHDLANTVPGSATHIAVSSTKADPRPAESTATAPGWSTKTGSPTVTPLETKIEPLASFDYFVLSLSWSPEYCAASGGGDTQQCSTGRKLAFVLHGLWPQNEKGYPSSCTAEKMPASVEAQFAGLYPNDSLFSHEWSKHGTCTGLSPQNFLTLSRQMKASIQMPAAFVAPQKPFRITTADVKNQFSQANPGFDTAAFEVNCSSSGKYLAELYVCLTRTGEARACSAEVHKNALKSCQNPDFLVRNIR
jgi:ribonuclease T2